MLPESCLSFIASTNRGNWSLVPLVTPHFPSSCSSLQLSYWVKTISEGAINSGSFVCWAPKATYAHPLVCFSKEKSLTLELFVIYCVHCLWDLEFGPLSNTANPTI